MSDVRSWPAPQTERVGPGPRPDAIWVAPTPRPIPAVPARDGLSTRLGRVVRRSIAPGPLLDGVIVVSLFATDVTAQALATSGHEVTSPDLSAGAALLATISAAVMWWRRSHPIVVLAAVLGLYGIAAAVIEPVLFTQGAGATFVLALYAVASWSSHRRWATASPAVLLLLVISGALGDGKGVAESMAVALAVVALPWALGYAARTRRLYVVEVEQRLADAERARDDQARRAVLDERAHIARELHDVVAHHVSLIGVQAGAARISLPRSPADTQAALEAIEAASRAAVGEMRHVLDALRDDHRGDIPAPQPRLADLDRLLEGFRRAGIQVDLRRRADRRADQSLRPPCFDFGACGAGETKAYRSEGPDLSARALERGDGDAALPALVDLCCYRIIEEALTNVTRHSGASRATVDIAVRRYDVRLVIVDPGPPRRVGLQAGLGDDADGGRGRGLIGMSERVALFGGTLAAGPQPDGGFAVVVELPIEQPARSDAMARR